MKKTEQDQSFVEIAMSTDIPAMAATNPDFTTGELQDLSEKMRTVMTYWIASMTPEHRSRMDERIVSEFQSDMSKEAALFSMRDFINRHAPDAKMGIKIYADSPAIHYQIEAHKEPAYWMDVINAVTKEWAYRLCNYCGKPFVYKSKKAMYCSDTCRTYASRERNKK
jgi:hypothetical protein